MPGGQGVSGNRGDVKVSAVQVSEIKGWTADFKQATTRYASNKTSSGGFTYKATVPGTREAAGSMDCTYDPLNPPVVLINIGSLVTLTLYTTATDNYSVPAVITSHKWKVDLDTGAYIGFSADWESNGPWTDVVAAQMPPDGFVMGDSNLLVPDESRIVNLEKAVSEMRESNRKIFMFLENLAAKAA